ncbi:MAG: T9SS type A sorting domain-containing protein [Flavobacterium sp.]|uniref:T9SS type A sorting domain-containing protein n=1 Tax=Flavobacterium sp. TaxID=239 RepID=UPI00121BABA6|nr:T9SS type A sorting domain-containing protein [Flavobacterium sp.]RZJ65969.1 MAG: T9SS type A sorting domain-containing protein [Flavobacterium sp.]
MKKLYALLFMTSAVLAQAPAIDWQRTIGSNGQDGISTIAQTPDGGYLVGANSQASDISGEKTEAGRGQTDYWVLKTDSIGNIQWQRTIGGNDTDIPTKYIVLPDGSSVILGYSYSNANFEKTQNSKGFSDFWIVKLSATGQIIWQHTYGANMFEMTGDIIATTDGGFLIGGTSTSGIDGDKTEASRGQTDYWILKLDSSGNIQWQKTLGGSSYDTLTSVVQTNDGNFICAGYSMSGISGDRTLANPWLDDSWVVKLSATGTILWQRAYNFSEVSSVIELSDGNILLGGTRAISGPVGRSALSYLFKSVVVKTNASGQVIWTYEEQPITGECRVSELLEFPDGGIYFTSYATEPTFRGMLTKLNASGTLAWNRIFANDQSTFAMSLCKASNNSIIVGLSSNAGIFGDKTEESRGMSDVWIVKFSPEQLSVAQIETEAFSVYPNPVKSQLNVKSVANAKVTVRNALGQRLISIISATETAAIDFPFGPGTYLVTIENENSQATKTVKVIK